MRFLVDTDVASYAIDRHPRVLKRWFDLRYADIGISALTEAELRYGALRRRSASLTADVDFFLRPYEIVEFSTAHVPTHAQLRLELERKGQRIGEHDMLIAAQALSLGLVLVTNNEREFRRVPGLKIENWSA